MDTNYYPHNTPQAEDFLDSTPRKPQKRPSPPKTLIALVPIALLTLSAFGIAQYFQKQQFDTRSDASIDSKAGCGGFTLSPQKTSYKPGETITINVATTISTNTQLYWIPAYLPTNVVNNWHQISGSFNPTTQTFTANWTLPTIDHSLNTLSSTNASIPSDQEIIIAANVYSGNNLCSGNPSGFIINNQEQCSTGVYFQPFPSATSCCAGCQKRIAIDSTPKPSASTIDMNQYWNFKPGNSWNFNGNNYSYPTGNGSRSFKARITADAPQSLLNNTYIPLSFFKDKASGYIVPQNYNQPANSIWAGMAGWRLMSTNFNSSTKWNNRFTGLLFGIPYNLDPTYPLRQFTSIIPSYGYTRGLSYDTGSEHFYFAPYTWSPRYLPNNPSEWSFKRLDAAPPAYFNVKIAEYDKFYSQPQYTNNYSNRTHGWEVSYGWETLNTPVYSGQVLRAQFFEYEGMTGNNLFREDWLLAPSIGPVMIRQYHNLPNRYTGCSNSCNPQTDPNCSRSIFCDDNPTNDNPYYSSPNSSNFNQFANCEPGISDTHTVICMKATSLFAGGTLSVTSPPTIQIGNSWSLNASTSLNGISVPYTGKTEIMYSYTLQGTTQTSSGNSISEWFELGNVTLPTQSVGAGTWTFKFRPLVNDPDSSLKSVQETAVTYNKPDWSQSITVVFTQPTTPSSSTTTTTNQFVPKKLDVKK